jgi:hypothetical protein
MMKANRLGTLVVGVGVALAAATGRAETITVPPCGYTPGTTSGTYSGLVTLTVSGLMVNTPPNGLQDGFYGVYGNNLPAGACPPCFRYNRVSEGTCLCGFECPATSHAVSDVLVGPYPAFDPSHVYTVTLDLGAAPAEQLNFAPFDCGCFDNSGQFTVTIEAATTTTSTTTTTSSLPEDAGYVPPDPASAKCETAVIETSRRLMAAIMRCHVKLADAARRTKSFDEEGCEVTAEAKYDAAIAKLLAKGGCPACVQANVSTLKRQVETTLDLLNGQAYCAGTMPLP